MPPPYFRYEDVPWHRRGGLNNVLILLGLVGCLPFALFVCYNLLTGGCT